MTKLKPTPGNLIVRELPTSEMTESGYLYIPATANRQNGAKNCIILAINPPPDEDPDEYFKVGQQIIIGNWQGTEVTVGRGKDAQQQIVINESSVLAIVEEEDGNLGGTKQDLSTRPAITSR